MSSLPDPTAEIEVEEDGPIGCVMVFNANDPSGAGGITADITSIASIGAHALPVITGAYARDSAEVYDHFCMDDEAVTEQARTILEDVPVQVIKTGFVGSPENLSAIAELASDYSDIPLVAYMPDLSWWQEDQLAATGVECRTQSHRARYCPRRQCIRRALHTGHRYPFAGPIHRKHAVHPHFGAL